MTRALTQPSHCCSIQPTLWAEPPNAVDTLRLGEPHTVRQTPHAHTHIYISITLISDPPVLGYVRAELLGGEGTVPGPE